MTNGEYNKDKILEMCDTDVRIAIGKDGEIQSCKEIGCRKCVLFDSSLSCQSTRIKWLYEEHKEEQKLTKQEHAFCEMLETGYIARDEGNMLCYYYKKVVKNESGGIWEHSKNCSVSPVYEISPVYFPVNLKFNFITWEDEEPWSVEDLLKLEVIE